MKKWLSGSRRRAAVALGALILTALWWFSEPRYQGRSLSSWLSDFDSVCCAAVERPSEAVEAVRRIGPRAAPVLVSLLGTEDSRVRDWIDQQLDKQSILKWRPESARRSHNRALHGFEALGEQGASAVPAVGLLLQNPLTTPQASAALCSIGAPAVPCLISNVAHSNAEVRLAVLRSLAAIPSATPAAADAAVRLSGDPDATVRISAIRHASYMTNESEVVWPMVAGALDDADGRVRVAAVQALRRFRRQGLDLLPKLLERARTTKHFPEFATVAQEVGAMDPSTNTLVSLLIDTLSRGEAQKVRFASVFLRRCGAPARKAVPALVEAFQNRTNDWERSEIGFTLWQLDPAIAQSLGITNSPDASPTARARRRSLPPVPPSNSSASTTLPAPGR